MGWGGSCRGGVVGHVGVGGVGWVMKGWVGWVMKGGWGGSCRVGGVGHAGVGWGSCRGGVGHAGVGWGWGSCRGVGWVMQGLGLLGHEGWVGMGDAGMG